MSESVGSPSWGDLASVATVRVDPDTQAQTNDVRAATAAGELQEG